MSVRFSALPRGNNFGLCFTAMFERVVTALTTLLGTILSPRETR